MLYIITCFIIIIDCILMNNNRTKKILIVLNFILLFIILGWAKGAYDIEIGISRYINPEKYESFTEPLYNFIIKIGNAANLNYRQFYAIIAFIELICIFKFVLKYSNNPIFVLLCFILYPMAYVFTLNRFFTAYIIILCGAIDVLLKKEKYYEVKYVIYVIIASCIHYSCIFFLLYLIADKVSYKKLVITTIVIMLVLFNVKFFKYFINLALLFVSEQKINNVLNNAIGYGILGRVVTSLVMFFTYYFIHFLNKDFIIENEKWNQEKNNLVYKINIVNLVCLPLIVYFGIGFSRIYTISMLLYYISISNMLEGINLGKVKLYQFYGVCILVFCISFELFATYRHETMRELSFRPMFEQNELFDWSK